MLFDKKKYRVNKTLKQIKSKIDDPKIKFVSFDVFDTLLYRPAIEPSDIYYAIDQKVKKDTGFNFYKLRIDAEQGLGKEDANIDDIWNYIAKEHSLSDNDKTKLMNYELEGERNFLLRRKFVYQIYQYAVKHNKNIIAISDMYLPSAYLCSVLNEKGYSKISKVFVSCEMGARKDDGKLFYKVIQDLGINSNELIHIGDNYYSDYLAPRKIGLYSFYIPSNNTLFRQYVSNRDYNMLMYSFKGLCRIEIGYIIAQVVEDDLFQNAEKTYGLWTPNGIGSFFIGSVLLQIAYYIYDNPNYHKVYFTSRDGYLPSALIKKIKDINPDFPSAEYFYASRRAYSCVTEDNFSSNLEHGDFQDNYTLEDYLRLQIVDGTELDKILGEFSEKERIIHINDVNRAKQMLENHRSELEKYFQHKKKTTIRYYRKLFQDDSDAVLIFDCGYSGSVSLAMASCFKEEKYFDKLYLRQTDTNIQRDKKFGTKTYCVFDAFPTWWMDLFFENLFSPLEGSCIGFKENEDGTTNPLFEKLVYSKEMEKTLNTVQRSALDVSENFLKLIKDYGQYYKINNIGVILQVLKHVMRKKCNYSCLNSIKFADPSTSHDVLSLGDRIKLSNQERFKPMSILYKIKSILFKGN